jgi:undecaprenyl-diphosphatase
MMTEIQAIIIAIIEGITEFLPVSSTGHMILTSSIMGIAEDDFTKLFTIVIQLGAILSVLVLYWKRFLQSWDFYKKLLVAFLPAVFLGLLFNDLIDKLLESPLTVAVSLVLGGIILLKVDDWFGQNKEKEITYKKALKIGFYQTLAMIPGVSRSGASIVGGMMQKLDRKTATEFSFFLAVPTMFGATAKKLWDYYQKGLILSDKEINLLLIGNIVAFVVAMIAIKSFINYISNKGFKIFGYYRIIIGLLIIGFHFWIQNIKI